MVINSIHWNSIKNKIYIIHQGELPLDDVGAENRHKIGRLCRSDLFFGWLNNTALFYDGSYGPYEMVTLYNIIRLHSEEKNSDE